MTTDDELATRRVQYETAGIDVDDLDPDPIVQWHRWYADASSAGLVEPNAMTIATVDADGRPDARIVLARGADERGFVFFTGYDSAKSEQLAARPFGAATFAWLGLHRQVRLRGRVHRVTDEDSDAYFAARPRGSQVGAWASPQSSVIADRAELERSVADVEARFAGVPVLPRPANWGGWRLVPEQVEFWQGRPFRLHDRLRYRLVSDRWKIERLAP